MAAVGQVEAHDGVAGREHGGIRGLVGLRSGVRLHVDVLGAEQLAGAVAGQVLHHVGELAAAVVALPGIAFGVLVGEDAGGGFEHRFGGEVLAGDEFELGILPLGFVLDRLDTLRDRLPPGSGSSVRLLSQYPPEQAVGPEPQSTIRRAQSGRAQFARS